MSLANLKEKLNQTMESLAGGPNLEKVMTPGFADKRLYAIYLTETYHYTKHNARNQALIATRPENIDPRYMKFCLRHAEEEVGHELMALHDLKAMGYSVEEKTLPTALNATQALIGYLYFIAEKGHPLARLGYSFWAERSYDYIRPMLNLISGPLGIEKKAMTFFNEHSEIDVNHAKQVDEVIERFVKTPEEWAAVESCMVTSLTLTARMLDEVFFEFTKLKNNEPIRYQFLS